MPTGLQAQFQGSDLPFLGHYAGRLSQVPRHTLPAKPESVLWVCRIADEFLRDPIELLVARDQITVQGISQVPAAVHQSASRLCHQFYVDCEYEDCKLPAMIDLIELLPVAQVLPHTSLMPARSWRSWCDTDSDLRELSEAMRGARREAE